MTNPLLDMLHEARSRGNRTEICMKYAWAIPDDEALSMIVGLNKPIVEMGAGLGYWANLLRQAEVDIIAYDKEPGKNAWCDGAVFTKVLRGEPEVLGEHSDRALFLCWPPYASDFASCCLNNYRGNTIIYIGEESGGCTADNRFFEMLKTDFVMSQVYKIPQWYGIHDLLKIYQRI